VKKKKKKGFGGIGYTSNNGKTWDVNAYLKNKKAKNEQQIKLIGVLQMLADSCSDTALPSPSPPDHLAATKRLLTEGDELMVKKLFLESALLPILEAALRSGSILEMAKEFDLYSVLIDLVGTFAKKKMLIALLSDIGPEYVPRQKDSLFKLLKKTAEMSRVFQDCLYLSNETSDTRLEESQD